MSVNKRVTRAGAAAFALGVALAGTPAAGVAVAAPSEDDASSVSTPNVTAETSTGHAGRAARGTSRRGDSSSSDPITVAGPGAPRGRASATAVTRRVWPQVRQSDTNSASAQPAAATNPVVVVPTVGTGSGTLPSVFAPAATTATPPAAAATAISSGPRGRVARAARAASVRPSVAAMPAATMGALVTGYLNSASNWFSGLPTNPFTELLQGALLLVRRTMFELFPTLNPGQTTGEATGTTVSPYYTDQELRDYLLGLAKRQYGSLFGQTVPVYGNGGPWMYDYLKVNSAVSGPRGTSDTNTQVNGVDEADFVETDGHYLYVAHNGQLSIVGTDLTVASQSTLSGNVVGEFLAGDRLTVITQSGYGWYGPMVRIAACGPWWPTNPQTTVTVYDVTDRTAPTVVTQTMFDGGFQDARAVDGVVYVVLQRGLNLPAPQYTDTPVAPDPVEPVNGQLLSKMAYWGWDSTVTANRTYETWDEYVARVGDQIVDLSLPHAYSVDAEGNTVDLGLVAGAEDIVRPHTGDAQSVLTLVSVDSANTSAGSSFADSVGSIVSGGGNTIYMNHDAMYVGTTEYQYSDSGSSNDTRIDRFTIDGTNVAWQASGLVSGTLINQFAMDEQGGYLHVATHTTESQSVGGIWSTRNDNGVYVLDTVGDTLDVTGSLTGLAPGEQLYAARFVGDKAYLVTFVQTDPLFAVDLSDPAAPTLLGELVIPGFSNYLQPVGDGLLVGIGQEREAGSWNTHVHATLFDVSDGANPTQITRQFLTENTQWSWSDAQFDHHALLYSADDGLLVVPVYGSGYDAGTGTYRSEQLLKVMRVTSTGLEVIGDIHTDQSVFRTVRIGDVLYAVSDSAVTAYSLSDLTQIGSTTAPSVV
jgi:uncharacterized secreted protein with C-terminal beta-propeller domain